MSNVQAQMANGAVWMVAFKLLERSLGLLSTLILVRLLAPADFGVVAMAGSFIAMAALLSAFGFDVALIQNQRAPDHLYHTAWTCNVALGVVITLLMLACAGPIATYYSQPNVHLVVCALALGPTIAGLENIGVVAFRKEMHFRREFAFQITKKLVGFAVVVPLAYYLHSYWALVAGILISRLAGTALSYAVHPFRPHLSLSGASHLFTFSKWLLINNITGFLKERSSDFVIGRLSGVELLGKYNVSFEVANLPTTELSAPINRALLPGFARLANQPGAKAAYTNAVGLLAVLALPAAAGIFAIAPLLVPVMLGDRWLDCAPLIEILAFNGALLLFHSSICTQLVASGHPRDTMLPSAIYVIILIALLVSLTPIYGVEGAAYAALSTSILTTPLYLRQVKHRIGVPLSTFVRAMIGPTAASIAMVMLIRTISPIDPASMPISDAAVRLLFEVGAGAAIYVSLIALSWWARGRPDGPEKHLQVFVQSALHRIRPPRESNAM